MKLLKKTIFEQPKKYLYINNKSRNEGIIYRSKILLKSTTSKHSHKSIRIIFVCPCRQVMNSHTIYSWLNVFDHGKKYMLISYLVQSKYNEMN